MYQNASILIITMTLLNSLIDSTHIYLSLSFLH